MKKLIFMKSMPHYGIFTSAALENSNVILAAVRRPDRVIADPRPHIL